jgi:hypothetical protein
MIYRLFLAATLLFGCCAIAQQPTPPCPAIASRLAGSSKLPFSKQPAAEQSENFLNATKYINGLLAQDLVKASTIRSKKDVETLRAWDAAHDDHCLPAWFEARTIATEHGILQKKHMSKDLDFEVEFANRMLNQMMAIFVKYVPMIELDGTPEPD